MAYRSKKFLRFQSLSWARWRPAYSDRAEVTGRVETTMSGVGPSGAGDLVGGCG